MNSLTLAASRRRGASALFGCLAVLLALGSWAGPARGEVTAESLLSSCVSDYGPKYSDVVEAVEKFKAGDVVAARAALAAAKKKHPKLPPARVMLAHLLLAAQQVGPARIELENVVLETPADPEPYFIFADLATLENQITDAELLLNHGRTLAAAFKDNDQRLKNFQIRGFAGLALVAERREKWQTALDMLTAWGKLDPDNANRRQRMGPVLFKLGKAQEAYNELKAGLKDNPKLYSADAVMGQLYEAAGDHATALKWMNSAVKRTPGDIPTMIAVGNWAIQTNELDLAKAQAESALKVDPKSLPAQYLAGTVARLGKDIPTAEKHLEAAALQAPGDFQVVNMLAQVLVEQTDDAKRKRAVAFAEDNMKKFPKSADAAATLGWVYFQNGRQAEAERVLQAALSTGQLMPDSAYFIARVMNQNERYDNAQTLLELTLAKPTPFAYRRDAEQLLAKVKAAIKTAPPSKTTAPEKSGAAPAGKTPAKTSR